MPAYVRSVVPVPAPVEAVAAPVPAPLGAFAATVIAGLDAVAAMLEPVGPARMAMVLGAFGATVVTLFDAIAAAIEHVLAVLADAIEAVVDAVAEIVPSKIARSGDACRQHQAEQAGAEQAAFGQGESGPDAHDPLRAQVILREWERPGPRRVDSAATRSGDGYDEPTFGAGIGMGDGFVALYIFMLAAIAGHVIISRVPVILHTPLMSGSNFIHGIVLIGAMVVLGRADTPLEQAIGFVAVLLGAGNAAGGYVVTERMLEMFKPSARPEPKA